VSGRTIVQDVSPSVCVINGTSPFQKTSGVKETFPEIVECAGLQKAVDITWEIPIESSELLNRRSDLFLPYRKEKN